MKCPWLRILCVFCILCVFGCALALGQTAGQNVTGTVVNATTGKPLAHSPVTLVLLQGNMKPVATSTTDDAGRYRFSQSTPGPYMVEADYDGVPYFAQVAAGQSETNVQVYSVNHDSARMQVDAEIMVLQPDAGQLAVVNEYRVENALQPPQTLAVKGGMFRFRVPAGAHVDMVRVVGPGEMPLSLAAQASPEHDVYGADAPLRPGETRVQVSYRVPYGALKAALSETPVVRPNHFEVYVPRQMTFQGPGFTQVGSQDGYSVYGTAEPVAATLKFNVAGDAPMPTEATGAADGAADAAAAPSSPEAAAPAPEPTSGATPTPTFLERNLWTMLALLGLAAAAGFGILLAQPKAADKGDVAQLKDDLFALELRRHTGELDEPDYALQRAALNARLDQYANADRVILNRGATAPPEA